MSQLARNSHETFLVRRELTLQSSSAYKAFAHFRVERGNLEKSAYRLGFLGSWWGCKQGRRRNQCGRQSCDDSPQAGRANPPARQMRDSLGTYLDVDSRASCRANIPFRLSSSSAPTRARVSTEASRRPRASSRARNTCSERTTRGDRWWAEKRKSMKGRGMGGMHAAVVTECDAEIPGQ